MIKKYLTRNASQTQKLAKILAKKVFGVKPRKRAFVISLVGELGSGKTTFLQGFAKGLGIKERVLSPTFLIFRKFKIPHSQRGRQRLKFNSFYHFDCYRIKKPKEILDLGWRKVINDPKNIIVIEWGDVIRKILPGQAVWLKFKFIDDNSRRITIKDSAVMLK